jgi:hypothetical protein
MALALWRAVQALGLIPLTLAVAPTDGEPLRPVDLEEIVSRPTEGLRCSAI